jgi:enolase-phosphatase E1
MKTILMDVEGTTTSISFVHDILFPYSADRLKAYVEEHLSDPNVQEVLLKTQNTVREEEDVNLNRDALVDKLLGWIRQDRKHSALKKLQGLIWHEGYACGEIKGHVYEDVPAVLKKWKDAGLVLAIYSSGSVEAQRSLFGHSVYGDLNPLFSKNFDTAVGGKREPQSYINILEELNQKAGDVLFLSDITEELDAAKAAGMQTIQLVRGTPVIESTHKQVKTFQEISF